MVDNIRFAHLNASAFTRPEIQHMILKKLGAGIQILNVVETHTTPKLEYGLRKKYPNLTFFFNHGDKQANRESHKEGRKGTMIIVVNDLFKIGEFKIHVTGQLSTLRLQIGLREYNFISIYAPSEKDTERSIKYFKNLFQTSIIVPTMCNILAGDWNCGLHEKDYLNYVDWTKYRPRTREIIKNAIVEHGLVDPFTTMNKEYEITENSGYTQCSQSNMDCSVMRRHTFKNTAPFLE